MRALVLGLGLAILMGGCVSPAVKNQAAVEVKVHRDNLADWAQLTPHQRQLAYQDSYDAWCAIHYAINGVSPPDEVRARLGHEGE